ncbi:MAG: hypothetical protein IPO87_14805 [Flavobacteriales bacterium]|nr:hypothetical protein [Flavobacteriales bacterium]
MLFNSFEFLVFFPLVFVLYWTLVRGSGKAQNTLLLTASVVFYAAADVRSLGLLAARAAIDYLLALRIANTQNERPRRLLFLIGISFNVGLLCFFKYFGFFHTGVVALLENFALHADGPALVILLPVGT